MSRPGSRGGDPTHARSAHWPSRPPRRRPVVLFDQGRGQRLVIEQAGELHLSGLAEVLRVAG